MKSQRSRSFLFCCYPSFTNTQETSTMLSTSGVGSWQGSLQCTHLCESLGTCMLACFVLLNMARWRSPKSSHLTCVCPGVTSSLLFPSYQMVGLVSLISHMKVKWEKWRMLEGSYKWCIMMSLLGQTIGVKQNFKRLTSLYARKFKVVSLTLTFTAHSHGRNIQCGFVSGSYLSFNSKTFL